MRNKRKDFLRGKNKRIGKKKEIWRCFSFENDDFSFEIDENRKMTAEAEI